MFTNTLPFGNNTYTRVARVALAAVAGAMALLAATSLIGNAFAKIEEVPTECENPSGKTPEGQQPECKNENLEQETENQNPSGQAPPGHNKDDE